MQYEKHALLYSKEEVLEEAIKRMKNGISEKEVKEDLKLTKDDLELIDFVINEF